MKRSIPYLLFSILYMLNGECYAQSYTDGPIQLRVRVRRVQVNHSASDIAILGAPDESRFKIWVRDNSNEDGFDWVRQSGATLKDNNVNPPALTIDFNQMIFDNTYTTPIVPQFFEVRLEGWEDDCNADIVNSCGTTDNDFSTASCCAGTGICGSLCIDVNDGKHCFPTTWSQNMDYRLGSPCEWYNHGFVTNPTCADYEPNIESYWRYTEGDDCNTPIALGTLNSGGSFIHFNSNICYNNSWTSSPGNDVFYSFDITTAMGVKVSLCNSTLFNTNLYILDINCNIVPLFFNNNGCGNQSVITTNLCTPGTYKVVVDGNAAVDEGTFTLEISEDSSVALNVGIAQTNVSCNGLSDGNIKVTVSGGTPGYNLNWAHGPTVDSIFGLVAGPYTLSVTDMQSCLVVKTVNITQPNLLAFTTAGTDPLCFNGSDGQIDVTASGGTLNYEYSSDSGNIYQNNNVLTGLSADIVYDIIVRDANLCTATGQASLTNPQQIQINAIINPESCVGVGDGSITPMPSGGNNPTYECAIGFPPFYGPCGTFSNLNQGSYIISIRDADGCEITDPNVNVNLVPAVTLNLFSKTDVTCNGSSDGRFTVLSTGGIPPLRYSINGGANFRRGTTFDSLTATTYTVLVQDSNGCTNTLNVPVDEPSVLVPSVLFQIPVGCFGGIDASIVINAAGGTGPYVYSMDSVNFFQSGFFNGLPGGNFNFYVVDDNDCPATLNANVIEPSQIAIGVDLSTNASCSGIEDGSLDLNGSGGTPLYEYSLNNGPFQPGDIFNNIGAGDYLIAIRDNNGCQANDSATVGANVILTSTINVVHLNCNGDNSGSIQIVPSGGSAPFDYSIDGVIFQLGQIFTGLSAGNYPTIARDFNGCMATQLITINEPSILEITLDNTIGASCPSIPNGSGFITVQGGVGGYVYLWSNGSNVEDQVNVIGGNYRVTVSDGNGCFETLAITIDQPNPGFTDITQERDVSCFGFGDGFVDLDIAGGVPPFSYIWSDGSSNQDLLNANPGTYFVTVSDDSSCIILDTATIEEPLVITATIQLVTPVSCAGNNDASLDLTVTGGVAPYRYFWTPAGGNAEDPDSLEAANYVVLITDANGCQQTAAIAIDEAPPLNATVTSIDEECFGSNDGSVSVALNGGQRPFSYQWSNGGTDSFINNLSPGIYDVTVIDNANCMGIYSDVVGSVNALQVDANFRDVECFGENNGEASVGIIVGGTGLPTYTWNTIPPSNAQEVLGLSPGEYILEVRDENDCLAYDTIIISEPLPFVANVSDTGNVTCLEDENGTVTLFAIGGQPPYDYFVTSVGFQSSPVYTGLAAGDYGFQVTDAAGCTATNSFSLLDPGEFLVRLNPVQFVALGTTAELAPVEIISDAPIISYQWFPPEFLNCDTCMITNVTPARDITYTLEITDTNGCSTSAQITISIKDMGIFVPTAFSPNGDMLNDIFLPIDFGSADAINIQIFNRWGAKVFESNNINDGWDGTFKGKRLQPGVFIVKILATLKDGTPFEHAGSVTLLQ